MAERDYFGLAVTARLGGHPIHPMLVPFPIALLIAVFLCDLVFWSTGGTFWAEAAMWALGAALVFAALAAIAGLTDFLGNKAIRDLSDAWKHMIGNVIAVLLSLGSFAIRYYRGAEGVVPWGLLLSAVVVVILLYTGWKGGHLVYVHRVGVHPEAPAERTGEPSITPR